MQDNTLDIPSLSQVFDTSLLAKKELFEARKYLRPFKELIHKLTSEALHVEQLRTVLKNLKTKYSEKDVEKNLLHNISGLKKAEMKDRIATVMCVLVLKDFILTNKGLQKKIHLPLIRSVVEEDMKHLGNLTVTEKIGNTRETLITYICSALSTSLCHALHSSSILKTDSEAEQEKNKAELLAAQMRVMNEAPSFASTIMQQQPTPAQPQQQPRQIKILQAQPTSSTIVTSSVNSVSPLSSASVLGKRSSTSPLLKQEDKRPRTEQPSTSHFIEAAVLPSTPSSPAASPRLASHSQQAPRQGASLDAFKKPQSPTSHPSSTQLKQPGSSQDPTARIKQLELQLEQKEFENEGIKSKLRKAQEHIETQKLEITNLKQELERYKSACRTVQNVMKGL